MCLQAATARSTRGLLQEPLCRASLASAVSHRTYAFLYWFCQCLHATPVPGCTRWRWQEVLSNAFAHVVNRPGCPSCLWIFPLLGIVWRSQRAKRAYHLLQVFNGLATRSRWHLLVTRSLRSAYKIDRRFQEVLRPRLSGNEHGSHSVPEKFSRTGRHLQARSTAITS